MIITRTNRIGLQFVMTPVRSITGKDLGTIIRCGSKQIIVDHDIDTLSQAWYMWQMRGLHIQHAFPFLTDAEREFLLSGITPEEWTEMFKEELDDKSAQ